jgi:hypothetical protein
MDDLSGLDWSANASGNKPKPMVANPSYPPYRSSPSPFGTGQSTPLSAQQSNNSLPKAAPAKVAQDSFSNLAFGLPKTTQKLSLAERQAQLEAEKRKKEEERRKLAEAQFGNGQHWDALGSRGFTPSPAPLQQQQKPAPAPAKSLANDDDDDLFAAFNRDTKVDNASHYPPPAPSKDKLDLTDSSAWGSTKTSNGNGAFGGDDDDDPFGLHEVAGLLPLAQMTLIFWETSRGLWMKLEGNNRQNKKHCKASQENPSKTTRALPTTTNPYSEMLSEYLE